MGIKLISLEITKPKRYYDGKGYERKLIGTTEDGRKLVVDTEVSYRGCYSNDASLEKLADEIRRGEHYRYEYVDNSNKEKDDYVFILVNPDNGIRYKGVYKSEQDAQEVGETLLKGDYQVQKVKLRNFVESKLLKEDRYEHEGSNEKDYTLNCNLDDGNHNEFKRWLEEKNLIEDFTYELPDGKLGFEGDVLLQFDVGVEDSDEYVEEFTGIIFQGEDIKSMVEADLPEIEKYLEDNYLESYSYSDWIDELRSDYYHSVL